MAWNNSRPATDGVGIWAPLRTVVFALCSGGQASEAQYLRLLVVVPTLFGCSPLIDSSDRFHYCSRDPSFEDQASMKRNPRNVCDSHCPLMPSLTALIVAVLVTPRNLVLPLGRREVGPAKLVCSPTWKRYRELRVALCHSILVPRDPIALHFEPLCKAFGLLQ